MQMKEEKKMHYWRISLRYHDVYWFSAIDYSLFSVPREAVFDGHMLGTFLSSVQKVEKISKEQFNEFMFD